MNTIEDVDFSDAGASLSFEIPGLPKSPSTHYITAFFDEDGSGYMDGPTPGDLVVSASADDLAFVLSDTTPVTINLELNQAMD